MAKMTIKVHERKNETDELTKEGMIKAFEQMRDAYWTIRRGLGDFGSGPVYDELDTAFNGSKATEIYPDVFALSFDELPMVDWCNAMVDFLKTAPSKE